MQKIITLFSCISFLVSCAQYDGSTITPLVKTYTHYLSSTPVTITVQSYPSSSPFTFLILHHDEQTAHQASVQFAEQNGGQLISIENGNERTLSFFVDGKKYTFDPNRVFTDAGIKKTLELYGDYNETAAKQIKQLATFILSLVPDESILVAMHNNRNHAYSVSQYEKGGILYNETEAVYRDKNTDADDFVFTTSKEVFDVYKNAGINVVCQQNEKATDDGSLSIYYGRQKKTYINIEAEHNHLEQQIKMLEILLQIPGLH